MAVRGTTQGFFGSVIDRLVALASPLVPAGSRLRPMLRAVRDRLPTGKPIDPLNRLLSVFAKTFSEVTFIQIGANDGDKGDYLEAYVETCEWNGVLVEPIPYVFSELTKRHGANSKLTLVNAAITDHDGTAKLYYLPRDDTSNLPPWYDALATFRQEVILKHAPWIPDIDTRVKTIEVPALTFDSLCTAHGIRQVDLVQMDTEGYDYEIIKQIDLDKYRPALILYEHYHLDPDDRRACELHLRNHGYGMISNFMDTLSVRIDPADRRSTRLLNLLARLHDEAADGGQQAQLP